MPQLFKIFAAIVLSASLTPSSHATEDKTKTASDKDAQAIAVEAYIYGYPLVTMEISRKVMTNSIKPQETGGKLSAPMGQFCNVREYPTAAFKDVVSPNADTLYSSAWLDLKKEPYVLSIPDEKDRYYLFPMLSGWTEVFDSPGKRTTGTKAQKYAITGPGWKGNLPKELKEIQAPTNMVWIIARTYSTGTPEDFKAVHELQNQYILTPLSSYGKPYTPPAGNIDPAVDMKTPVVEQVNKMEGEAFFKLLADLMKDNPPAAEDKEMVEKLAKIGLVPGQDFDVKSQSPAIAKAIQAAPKEGLLKIQGQMKTAGKEVNGWQFLINTGSYGTNYLQRAFVTLIGLGANLPEDAIYPRTTTDSKGTPLSGANKYKIHFDKGKLPPVKGFWSLTMYTPKDFFATNALNRYTLSARSDFKYNADGSLDLYIQHDNPGKDKESNWLPAPADDFHLMFRFYWPEDDIINGKWKLPPVNLSK